MITYQEEVGARLKQIRSIFNEGGKLSADQFAFLLGETRDKIANYELGRASLPIRVLYELYKRGINPIYIISGEDSIFANNEVGQIFKEKIIEKIKLGAKFNSISQEILNEELKIEQKTENQGIIKLAAGKISKKDDK